MYRQRSPQKPRSGKERFWERRCKWLLGSLLGIAALLGFLIWDEMLRSRPSTDKAAASIGQDFWLEDDDLLLYLEAMAQIKNQDAYLRPGLNRRALIQESLKAFAEKTDPFAAYMTSAEFAQWQKKQGDDYVGMGMEIIKDSEGRIVCLPYSGSPAAMAGIRAGDELVSIEGTPVRGRSVLAISAMARSPSDTGVTLLIRTRMGEEKQLAVKGSRVSFDSVSNSTVENIQVIKISAFTRDSKDKFEKALAEVGKSDPLVIDLRGNAGGDLSAAVDSAKLLLTDHKRIVSVKTRQGVENHDSGHAAVNTGSLLFLWQNEGTASAAEVFIAALTRNHRAVSIGRKSFGKGTRQEVFELSDGSALFLTTGFLHTPDGSVFDGQGLRPDYALESASPETADYLLKVKGLLKGRP